MNKDNNNASFNWYPGHMAKAFKDLENSIKLVELVIEVRDARMPFASSNKALEDLCKNKNRLIILNKADLLDKESLHKLESIFNDSNILLLDSKKVSSRNIIISKIKELSKPKIDKNIKRGIKNTEIRVMIVGIPNVGKSTIINTVSSKKSVKVENKPGVTRSLQWVSIDKSIKLLDTPGVFSPKFNNNEEAMVLSILGSINDDVINIEECAEYACKYINTIDKNILIDRYGIAPDKDYLEVIGNKNNIYKGKGIVDVRKTAHMIINDIRNGKLGNFIWEKINA